MLRKFISKFDMFGAAPTFRMQGETQTVNLCMGLFSICILLAFFYVFINKSLGIIRYQEIDPITTVTKNLRQGETVDVTFLFAFGIRGYNLTFALQNYNLDVFIQQSVNNTKAYLPFQMQRCVVQDWQIIGQRQFKVFQRYQMHDRLCPKPNQTVTMRGLWNSQANNIDYTMLKAVIRPCSNSTTKNNCLDRETQQKNMLEYFNTSNYVIADMLYFNTAFSPSEKEPLVHYIQDHIHLTFTNNTGVQSLVQIATYTVWTDTSMTPVNLYEGLEGTFISNYLVSSYEIRNDQVYVVVNMMLDAQDIQFQRQYGKLDDTLSYVGGLFSLCIAFFGVCFMSFNEYRYQLYVGQTFSLNDGNKIKEQDFDIIKYVKYGFYDWIKTFGCCQPNWQDCQKIDQARQQASEQINVQNLLKRIAHLQQVVSFFISQEEDICTYLTEGQYIDHVRKRRKILNYYDKIVKGKSPLTIQNMNAVDTVINMTLKAQLLPNEQYELDSMRRSRNSKSVDLKSIDSKRSLQNKSIEENEQKKDIQNDITDQKIHQKLEQALKRGGKIFNIEDEQLELDDQDKQVEFQITEAFYKLCPKIRQRMQNKIPLKILKRLKYRYQKELQIQRVNQQYLFYQNRKKKKKK